MRTNVKELSKTAQDIEEFRDAFDPTDGNFVEHLEAFFGEANATQAFEFFKITYDNDTGEVTVPGHFNYKNALEVVTNYLEKMEKSDAKNEDYSEEVNRYDAYTAPHRGADDGTFDYAGTYVISILELLEKHSSSTN